MKITPRAAREAASLIRTGTPEERKAAAAILKQWQVQTGTVKGSPKRA